MQITDVQIYPRGPRDTTGLCTCDLRRLSARSENLSFCEQRRATGVSMPEVKQQDGTFRTIAYPTDDKMLKAIEDAVIAEYKKVTGASIRSRRRVWLLNPEARCYKMTKQVGGCPWRPEIVIY